MAGQEQTHSLGFQSHGAENWLPEPLLPQTVPAKLKAKAKNLKSLSHLIKRLLNNRKAPVSISEWHLQAIKHCRQGGQFSPKCIAVTETVFRKVLRGDSRSLQGLWVWTVPYSSAFCRYSSHTFPLQTRAIRGRAQVRSQSYSQQGKRSPIRLFVISTWTVPISSTVSRGRWDMPALCPALVPKAQESTKSGG